VKIRILSEMPCLNIILSVQEIKILTNNQVRAMIKRRRMDKNQAVS
jgi:hypothetical protein